MRRLILAVLGVLVAASASAQIPRMAEADRIRIAEVRRLAGAVRNDIWKGWSQAGFGMLLVTNEHEYLVYHPDPGEGFENQGYDSLLSSQVYARPRQFPPNLLATFPALGKIPVIVIGQPENTDTPSSDWIVVALHEHFHQWQYADPHYYQAVTELDLARGDQTGMWMLEYKFPYDSAAVVTQFGKLSHLLLDALNARGTADFAARNKAYWEERAGLKNLLRDEDYRYLSFQLWQEGVARYTQMRVAASDYEPSDAFRALPDYRPMREVAASLQAKLEAELATLDLTRMRRVAFYPLGAAEALLLDESAPGWHQRYLTEKFYLERYQDQ